MTRSELLQAVKNNTNYWDVLIIGGGATGMGCAVDAASRGYKTLLLEMHDFGKGTSSRSTKLIHGGVRYLQQGNVSLVIEALKERAILIQNAPHLANPQSFVVPNYKWWNGPFYGAGLKVYDMLAGKLNIQKSKSLSIEETLKHIPTIKKEGLLGGTMYYDGQFDDSRLIINLAQTAANHGAIPLNYMKVSSFLKNKEGFVEGVRATNMLNNEEHEIHARCVINATGVFVDGLLTADNPEHEPMVQCSQGVHIVLGKKFLPKETAIMVPHTDDGRVLFLVPWHGRALVGTTDTPVAGPSLEPEALDKEIDFILKHTKKYLSINPSRKNVKSVFAGLRPLLKQPDKKSTSQLSRSHYIHVSLSGLITIAGGKWTTYRKMAEDTIDQAAIIAGLDSQPCVTANMPIHGGEAHIDSNKEFSIYGSDAKGIQHLIDEDPSLAKAIHPKLPYTCAEIVWAVKHEMAMKLEDVLARRTRALLLDAKASLEAAPRAVNFLAKELNYSAAQTQQELKEYATLAANYIIN